MKIGVIGAKTIGGTLATTWVRAGHMIMFGVRDVGRPETQALVRTLGPSVGVGTVREAIVAGDVVLFAIPGAAMASTIREWAAELEGKTIIDATNRVGAAVMNSLADFFAHTPRAQVFRAFNSLGWENFENPRFGDVSADLFYCGPSGTAQAAVEELIRDVGLRPICLGGPEQAHLVDAVAGIWFALAQGQKMGRHLAFKVLVRS